MNRYGNNYVPGDKFQGGYFKFALVSGNITYMILLLLLAVIATIGVISYGPFTWWIFCSFIPFIIMCYLNYTSWRERQQGKTS